MVNLKRITGGYMNKNINVKRTEKNGITQVELIHKNGYVDKYTFKTDEEYINNYLSEENLSYYVARNDEDEEDNYLLNALQNQKKLCVTFYTRNYRHILDMYSEEEYNTYCKKSIDEVFGEVYAARKGCISNYFDVGDIAEWYAKYGIKFDLALFEELCNAEMIDLLSGRFRSSKCFINFCHKMNFERFNDPLLAYQNEGIAVTGLLLGYPLESSRYLIKTLNINCKRYESI